MRSVFFGLLVIIAFSCSSPEIQRIHLQGKAQGTYYSIMYFDPQGINYQEEIDSLLDAYNKSVSLYDTSSVISRLNRNETDTVDEIFIANYRVALQVAEQSAGYFDFTVGQLVSTWGFGLKNRDSISSGRIDSLLKTVGYNKVKLSGNRIEKEESGTWIDFNAIAQGYSVDLVGRFLESKGIERYLVDIGGEVLARGRKEKGEKWSVGIELPQDNPHPTERTVQTIASIEDMALATSGNYRKFYIREGVKYSHTIDPKTGYPVQHSLLSASVFAPSAAVADAWATAFMVMGTEKAIETLKMNPELGAYLIYSDDDGNYLTFFTDNVKMLLSNQ